MAKLYPVPCPGPWNEPKDYTPEGFREAMRKEYEALEELYRRADTLPEGDVVGAVVQFLVGDAFAHYLVVKAKPLTVQHIPLGGGSYRANPALLRGLNLADVQRQIKRNRALPRLAPLI